MASVTLADIGQVLYGKQWQSDLARDLNVSDRTIRRWANDYEQVPFSLWAEILLLLANRKEAIEALLEAIKAEGTKF